MSGGRRRIEQQNKSRARWRKIEGATGIFRVPLLVPRHVQLDLHHGWLLLLAEDFPRLAQEGQAFQYLHDG